MKNSGHPPLISCIVPVFNGARYIKQALESIWEQTYQPLEIIVVDDGSTDDTKHIVQAIDRPVRYVSQNRMGPAAARNRGIAMSQGEFLAFLDSDDLWHSGKLSKQFAKFSSNPEIDACVTFVNHFVEIDSRRKEIRYQGKQRLYDVPGYITQTLLAKRTTFEKVGNFDQTLNYGDANEWFLRVADSGLRVELLPEVLVYRRLHGENHSRQGVSAGLDEHLRIIKASLDRRRDLHGGIPQPYPFPTSHIMKAVHQGENP